MMTDYIYRNELTIAGLIGHTWMLLKKMMVQRFPIIALENINILNLFLRLLQLWSKLSGIPKKAAQI